MSVTINLPPEVELRLAKLALDTGRPQDKLLADAIISGLEDIEDILLAENAIRRLESGESHILSAEEEEREFGLDR